MSEQEFRDGLWAAVSDEPTLSFDPDVLIIKARQDIRRRRTLVGAGAATAAVAVAAVAVPTVLGSPRGFVGGGSGDPALADGEVCATASVAPTVYYLPSAPSESLYQDEVFGPDAPVSTRLAPVPAKPSGPPSPTGDAYPPPGSSLAPPEVPVPTPVPCPSSSGVPTTPPPPKSSGALPPPKIDVEWPPANITPATYTAEQLKQRAAEMQAHLRDQFAKVVPGATEVNAGPLGGEAAGEITEGQTYLNGFTGFTLNKGRAAVDIYVSAPGAPNGPTPNQECGTDTPPDCKIDQGLSSGLLVYKATKLDDSGQIMSVTHFRANGTVVRATGYNYDPTTSVPPTYLPQIPVTLEQPTALATDPALAL